VLRDGKLVGVRPTAELDEHAVIGMMVGARIGARLLTILKASVVRKLVLGLLLFSGARALLKGLGIWA
jgi:hypothetical protein